MGEYLIFESCGYQFALPSSAVASLSERPREDSVSFAEKVFRRTENEASVLTLTTGLQLRVSKFIEIQELKMQILPVPGYIFDDCNDWLRGIFWGDDAKILLLNEGELECTLCSI